MTRLSRDSHFDTNVGNIEKKEAKYADFMHRLAALLFDGIFYSISSVILALIFNFFSDLLFPDLELNLDDETVKNNSHSTLSIFMNMCVPAAVFGLFLSSKWQATPGKRLMSIYVTDKNLDRISFFRGVFRYFVKCTPYIFIILIFTFVDLDSISGPLNQDPDNFKYEEYLANLPTGLIESIFLYVSIFYIFFIIWYLMAAFTKERTAFHDIICGTRVLKGRL